MGVFDDRDVPLGPTFLDYVVQSFKVAPKLKPYNNNFFSAHTFLIQRRAIEVLKTG